MKRLACSLFTLSLMVSSCGGESEEETINCIKPPKDDKHQKRDDPYESPKDDKPQVPKEDPKSEDPRDEPTAPSWADVETVLNDRCVRCHASAGFIRSGDQYRGSSSQSRVRSGNMPPPGSPEFSAITAEEKEILLLF